MALCRPGFYLIRRPARFSMALMVNTRFKARAGSRLPVRATRIPRGTCWIYFWVKYIEPARREIFSLSPPKRGEGRGEESGGTPIPSALPSRFGFGLICGIRVWQFGTLGLVLADPCLSVSIRG